jgi:hypothetical protein
MAIPAEYFREIRSVAEDMHMADQTNRTVQGTRGLSLDGWAVAIALMLAALVRMGMLKHISW